MGNVAGLAIVARRREAGISRRELARRAGTSAATLAKYERGEICPGVDTVDRVLDSVLRHRRRWNSLNALAAAVHEQFAAGHADTAWRICTEILDDEKASDSAETRLFASRAPMTTGDARTDAVVAAFGEWVCVRRGLPTPRWTLETRVCQPFWFPNPLPAFQAIALRESPPSFAARGIFVSRADLTTA